MTLSKVEKGDPGVALGIYARVMQGCTVSVLSSPVDFVESHCRRRVRGRGTDTSASDDCGEASDC